MHTHTYVQHLDKTENFPFKVVIMSFYSFCALEDLSQSKILVSLSVRRVILFWEPLLLFLLWNSARIIFVTIS